MSKRRNIFGLVTTTLAAAIVTLATTLASAQTVRGTAARPSNALGSGFRGNLGSNSFSSFRSQSQGYHYRVNPAGNTALNPGRAYAPVQLAGTALSLRPGAGSSGGLNRSGQTGARMNYGTNALSPGGGWQPFVGRNELSTLANAPTLNWAASVPLLGGSSAVATPRTTDSITRVDYEECVVAGQRAYEPITGPMLQRPGLSLQKTAPAATLEAIDENDYTHSMDYMENDTYRDTFQSGLFAARQLAEARDHLRRARYDAALVCYQSAMRLDAANVNAMVGAAYCQIMLGRFQAASYMVLRLASADPGFFHAPAGFDAVFGMSRDNTLGRLVDIRPQIDQFINTYIASPSQTERIRTVSMGYLVQAYIAYLEGDDAAFTAAVSLACETSPFSEPVQRLGRGVTGREVRAERPMEGVQPIQ